MKFRFLHTADWQLGKPFRNFEEKLAGVLEDERFNAIDRLADAARQANASHVLVAGDVFDAEVPRETTLRRPLDRMAAAAGLQWHLLPGNHDPARPGGVWDRLVALGLPANVFAHVSVGIIQLASGVALLPAPLVSKGFSADPTRHMDVAATPPGTIRIGLAHGTIQNFAGDGEAAATIDAARARKAGLSYLALGDWHGMVRIDERTWYSGTPEPDRFPSNKPGFALQVELEGESAAPIVNAVPTARFTWVRHTAELRSQDELVLIERHASSITPALDRLLLKLSVKGRLPAGEFAAITAWSRSFGSRLRYLEVDDTGLKLLAGAGDAAAFAGAPDLRRACERLQRMADDPAEPRQAAARLALARLHELADVAAGGEAST